MTANDDDLDAMRFCMQAAVQQAQVMSEYFHEELFRAAPELRRLYKMNLDQQGELLMNGMNMIMSQMHDVAALRPFVEDMAIRHVGYGVLPEHYPLVRDALVVAFRRLLGTRFTPQAEAAWLQSYDEVAAIMIEIAYGEGAERRAD